ncbi:MAG: hypothetical protein ACI87C_000299 [Paraperlucidibaca sp.]|jgi:hypothetical protein
MINRKSQRPRLLPLVGMMLMASATVATTAYASSHREAPYITSQPKVDGTDFYMFRSYEANRQNFVTLIANYLPLQDAYGGPNYFSLDPNALYEIHLDNNGDAVEDITFQFRFKNTLKDLKVPVGGKMTSIPLVNLPPQGNVPTLNVAESFTVTMVKGPRRGANSSRQLLTNAAGGGSTFTKPVDNIGNKSIPNYASYANQFIYNVDIPGCSTQGKIFVGQRKDSFVVNLGETFDLINIANPVGSESVERDDLADKNVTTLAMEIPSSCLTAGNEKVIGGWTTASVRQARLINPKPGSNNNSASKEGGPWAQVSRLGMPLVNEVIIGLKDKDKFNASQPKDDAQFADYVTNPSLPFLIEALFQTPAPTNFPRTDLVTAFLTGVPGLNQPANVKGSEMLRLNTSDVPPVPAANQNRLGVVAGDNAGFPNGRRPGDDVVDIELRVAMGLLCHAGLGVCSPDDAKAGTLGFTDGAIQQASQFNSTFPYLKTPLAGATSTN